MVKVRKKSWLCLKTVGLTSTPPLCTSPLEGHTTSSIDTEGKSCAAECSTTSFVGTLGYGILGAKLKFQPEGGAGGKLMECPKRK